MENAPHKHPKLNFRKAVKPQQNFSMSIQKMFCPSHPKWWLRCATTQLHWVWVFFLSGAVAPPTFRLAAFSFVGHEKGFSKSSSSSSTGEWSYLNRLESKALTQAAPSYLQSKSEFVGLGHPKNVHLGRDPQFWSLLWQLNQENGCS